MKSIFSFAAVAAIFALLFTGCKKEDVTTVTTKNVVYEVKFNETPTEEGTDFFVKVEYTGSTGNIHEEIDQTKGWKAEVKDVPASTKSEFKGFIDYVGARPTVLDFTISMTVSDAKTGKVLVDDKKVVKSVKESVTDPGFSKEEVHTKTEFSFKEN